MKILRWLINVMRSMTSHKTSQFWRGFMSIRRVSLKVCFKITFETLMYILKLITIIVVFKNYEVEFLFLCRDVISNEILGISDHIFLSVIFSWIRLVKGSKSGGHVAKTTQICFSKVQHWFHYLHISIWCQNNVAHKENDLFFI